MRVTVANFTIRYRGHSIHLKDWTVTKHFVVKQTFQHGKSGVLRAGFVPVVAR